MGLMPESMNGVDWEIYEWGLWKYMNGIYVGIHDWD
jgi:hypothetical protein